MSPVRQFTTLLLLAGLVACSGSPPSGPPYRQEVSAPACLQEETYGETMRCDDNVKAKIQKEANQSLGKVEQLNVRRLHQSRTSQWGSPSAQEVRDQMKIGHAFEIETERAAQAFTENCGSYRVDRGLLVCIPAPPN
ncbi:MAG: hypothetical protein VXZ92_09395 [SAR324 cluster bacterium]|nr:hypothetical protein [SAR324 cluster bacterium]MEC8359983.1 hypothetical protein [SAR324 cluster bacterium]